MQTTGFSTFAGVKASGARFVDHSALTSNGAIQRISLYYGKTSGCLRGIKAVYGTPAAPVPGVVGNSVNSAESVLKLADGEAITKAEYIAVKCVSSLQRGQAVTAAPAAAASVVWCSC